MQDGDVVLVPCVVAGTNSDGDLARLLVEDGASFPGPEVIWVPWSAASDYEKKV